LHVVLNYEPFTSTLIAELYDSQNQPNSQLPVPFIIVASYRFFRNGEFIQEIDNGDRVEFLIPRTLCSVEYRVFVSYTANGIEQPLSTASTVIGNNFVYGAFIFQTSIPGGIQLHLAPPPLIGIPINITWAKNYQIITPTPPNTFIAPGNGIYEVSFQSIITGLSYYAAIEVTGSSSASYVKTIGNDGNLYGTFGTPRSVENISFFPINVTNPVQNKIFVNGIQYSDNSFLNLTQLNIGDLIYFLTTDCCGITLSANTFILPCGFTPFSKNKSKSKKNNKITPEPYPRPIDNRPF